MHGSPTPRGTPSRRGRSPRAPAASPSSPTITPDFSIRPAATFTTCLSIPVEGALPIERPEPPAPTAAADSSAHPSSNESKRAPRKSKMDALVALHNHAQSSLGQEDLNDTINDDAGIRVQLHDGPPIAVSPRLDLSSVKTPKPGSEASEPSQRPFGLTNCPTFRPTPEQFKDPLAYIRSISDEGKQYGICKIVPPVGWNMPFVTDTEKFRFKTRLQRLNSIEASSRAKVNFLEQLYRFHKQQGNPRVSVPTINHKPLDLWLLRKEVHKLGGYDTVTRTKKWADLGRLLGYGGIPGLSTQMRNSYARVILPFEQFSDRAGRPSASGSASVAGDESPPSSPLTMTSSPLSEPPDEGDYKDHAADRPSMARPRRSARHSSQEHTTPVRKASNANEGVPSGSHGPKAAAGSSQTPTEPHCEVCHKKDRGEEMLLCDGCDCGFHMFCLDPPLSSIPKGQWFCHTCLFGTGGDFGFDEGEEHSLSSFQARDLEFRRLWFKSHPVSSSTEEDDKMNVDEDSPSKKNVSDPNVNRIGDVVVSETDVENEFWRLVQSPLETVEVEYGADVHSTTHGSGMPTLETHPLDPYSKDPWNLNNIPILPDSLLRYIKSDISGMTVPWTYVGMVFSTFCWHNEDHYTYSINYMHWGETKTWYSIRGADADKFEAAIKREAPDLFEAQPDLLFQLVTLMNPNRLKEAGLDVYACNQRAGEFVITFPRAYHAGFNHGLNFNEAVNFALPDWLPLGLDCMKRYQEHRKLPVFSHDELLITITQQSQTIQTALWLNESLQEMTEREMSIRARARSLQMNEVLEETDRAEEQYQCTICKMFCYLSQITCSCTTKVVCIDHVDSLCKCARTSKILRKRFEDTELQDIQAKVSERAAVPSAWRGKLNKLLSESARPPLRSLRALVAEGERINYPLSELHALRKCVTRANEWVDLANVFLVRKPSRKRARKSKGRASEGLIDDTGDKPERTLDDLYTALKEVDTLGFDCPEIGFLKNLTNEAEETRNKARTLLSSSSGPRDRQEYVQECERLLLQGSSINVLVDELLEVEKIVLREQLIKELDEVLDTEVVTLEEIRQYMARAQACDLSTNRAYMSSLEKLLHTGEAWEGRVKAVLTKPQRTLDELDEVIKARNMYDGQVGRDSVPADPELVDRLMSTRTRAQEYERQAKAWLIPEPGAPKPKVQEVSKLVGRGEKEFNIQAIQDLKRTVDFALDLEARCDAVLKNRYQHNEETDIFVTMLQWRNYAKEHLTMFILPNFDKLDKQIALHYRWLEGLPWFCRQHQEAHGQPILDDVVESTRPEDDLPPNDEYFTCICTTPVRPPAAGTVSDAVQCDHCYARFHGVCAANGGSCPFCDHHHWNGTIHKERSWHFCYLPTILLHAPDITKNYSEDWKQLEIIVHRVDRLSAAIGQFLSFASQPANQRPEYIPQVRHYMRKLYKIQFAVSPNPEVSFGLDLAGLHRILAGQPAPVRVKKRRRPKFTFGQDIDKDWMDSTRCICRGRTNYLLNYPTVECELCGKFYHAGCVFFPMDPSSGVRNRFMCPLCCLRKNRAYPYSEVRVKHIDNPEPDTYVDTKEMLDTFSKEIIYMKLPPPYTQTLFVELIRFTPGQPDNVSGNGAGPRNAGPSSPHGLIGNGSSPHPRAIQPPPPHPHHSSHAPNPSPLAIPFDAGRASGSSHHVPPPPPWASRWSNAAVAAAPPMARSHPEQLRSPLATPPQASRKRKYPEEAPPPPDDRFGPIPGVSSGIPSPKRRQTSHTPQPAPRTSQGLSPSLAMMLSPSPNDVRSPTHQPYSGRGIGHGSSSRMPDDGLPSDRRLR
ncbi:predicted protein [Sparassis crispa]|uniref:[histone H3]-trimethyl-L-lysine(4) demethylase n=1 Tax=Sparassis crispa TaxID=139825 RepID=A0A401GCG6_9APHY|nr:predicted protein [Sparassis crispa]GBE79852.1 predicted protein [Sparassis crispa]